MWILRFDRIEPEPLRYILKMLFLGSLSVIPAAIAEGLILGLPLFQTEGIAGAAMQSFLVISPVEEVTKLFIVLLFVWRNRNFNEANDGIVYAGTVSIGFAMAENLLYVSGHGLAVGIARAVTSIPGHTFTGVIMGYFLGLARFAGSGSDRNRNMLMAVLVPWLLHGAYDTFVLSGTAAALLLIPMVILNFVLGIRYLKKGRELSRRKWGKTHPEPEKISARSGQGTWKKVTAGVLLAVSGLFWLLIITGIVLGLDQDPGRTGEILAGSVILTAIPITAGVMLGLSYRKGRTRPSLSQ